MNNGIITQIDRLDDLVYEFYGDYDSNYIRERPELRFMLLGALLSDLCEFDLGNSQCSIDRLMLKQNRLKSETIAKSKDICRGIKSIVGEPTYFAASYWSPIDQRRHTISRARPKESEQIQHESRISALLFYILTYKAPPIFHSTINYISTKSHRKDGLHSHYGSKHPYCETSEQDQFQIWWHIPQFRHQEMLNVCGFQAGLESLLDTTPNEIEDSLRIIMENIDSLEVENEISKYKKAYLPILELAKNLILPDSFNVLAIEFQTFLNRFFFEESTQSTEGLNKSSLTIIQAFYMACTNILYNRACPTSMFYTFPVRVSDTCCVLTLGVESELPLENLLAMSHIAKSLFYHGLDRDYQALNALERNKIAHGAVHKIRGPLNILKQFPFDLEHVLKRNLDHQEFQRLNLLLVPELNRLKNSIENMLIGVKSLENFIETENPANFNLFDIVNRARRTYDQMKVRVIENIKVSNHAIYPTMTFGVESHTQFVFEELISNSIRAFKFHNKHNLEKKLIIEINILNNSSKSTWVVNFIDNGPGIPPEKKTAIFLSGNRGSDSGGGGRGLFISKLFLNKYGNEIVERGEFGKGANFQLTFKKSIKHEA